MAAEELGELLQVGPVGLERVARQAALELEVAEEVERQVGDPARPSTVCAVAMPRVFGAPAGAPAAAGYGRVRRRTPRWCSRAAAAPRPRRPPARRRRSGHRLALIVGQRGDEADRAEPVDERVGVEDLLGWDLELGDRREQPGGRDRAAAPLAAIVTRRIAPVWIDDLLDRPVERLIDAPAVPNQREPATRRQHAVKLRHRRRPVEPVKRLTRRRSRRPRRRRSAALRRSPRARWRRARPARARRASPATGSTAITVAPLATSSRVSLPVPAATSSTVRPGPSSSSFHSHSTTSRG